MKLSAQAKGNKQQQGKTVFGGLLLLLLAALFVLLISKSHRVHPNISNEITTVFCDAENTKGNNFINNKERFGGADFQSQEEARSGTFSLLLAETNQTVFAFNYEVDQPQAGTTFEVSVWRKGAKSSIGKLAAMNQASGHFYVETNETIETDDKGWERIQLQFTVPFNNTPEQLSFYVYSDGSSPIFFDDLSIKATPFGGTAAFKPQRINLKIESQEWAKIEKKRTAALAAGLLIKGDKDWVNAQIQQENETSLDVKIRLKGDWLDHLQGDKWSFRVKMKSPYVWNQLLVFNLHTPAARYHLHEWLLHEFWGTAGILSPRYDLLTLSINGESRGVYAYEEHFEKQLVEHQERREGPIIKLAEDGFWENRAAQLAQHGFIRTGVNFSGSGMADAPIQAFREEDLKGDSLQAQYTLYAKQLLNAYLKGNLAPAAVFDLPKLAAYYAICDLMNAYHGVVWHNQRFYYNPVSSKLEPIGFDGFGGPPPPHYHLLLDGALQNNDILQQSFFSNLLADADFITAYANAIEQYSNPNFVDTFLAEKEAGWQARLDLLQLEFPNYQPDLEELKNEFKFVRSQLYPVSTTCIRSYTASNGDLMLANIHSLPLKVIGFGQSTWGLTDQLSNPIWLPGQPNRSLFTKFQKDSLIQNFASIHFADEQALTNQNPILFTNAAQKSGANFVYYQVAGLDSIFKSPLVPQTTDEPHLIPEQLQKASKASDFPSLIFEDKQIIIPKDAHILTSDLIISAQQTLILQAGATIDLQAQASIICFGGIQAIGQADDPISVHSSDGTGQGLQVIKSPQPSVLRKVVFSNLRNLHRPTWHLTGAVTFYESAVILEECIFQNNQSEDGLNLVRCELEMTNVQVRNTSSDGIDLDFCKGEINGLNITQTANDGLDISGSIINLQNSRFVDCQDKGISVGEASDLFLSDVQISNAPIAIAAKDLSLVKASAIHLNQCAQGFVAFQKKREFGPAQLIIESYTATEVEKLYEIGPGSRLQLANKLIEN